MALTKNHLRAKRRRTPMSSTRLLDGALQAAPQGRRMMSLSRSKSPFDRRKSQHMGRPLRPRPKGGYDLLFIGLDKMKTPTSSHMFMLDKNNLQIADLILKWI